ncbi:hypothetical protein MSAN_02413400 [Mycena sanguinolenta]|uniref:Uncharacterized protein n=1 Tax=Mycena sanguinolenta TaxID=230812 RepID=A0A8H7CF25_9AGAR|nr:hypothetical protein MSAN_02413400 [Mycena sanguinolenta]
MPAYSFDSSPPLPTVYVALRLHPSPQQHERESLRSAGSTTLSRSPMLLDGAEHPRTEYTVLHQLRPPLHGAQSEGGRGCEEVKALRALAYWGVVGRKNAKDHALDLRAVNDAAQRLASRFSPRRPIRPSTGTPEYALRRTYGPHAAGTSKPLHPLRGAVPLSLHVADVYLHRLDVLTITSLHLTVVPTRERHVTDSTPLHDAPRAPAGFPCTHGRRARHLSHRRISCGCPVRELSFDFGLYHARTSSRCLRAPGRLPASRRGLDAIRLLEEDRAEGASGRLPRRDFRRAMGGHEMAASFRYLVVHPPCPLHIDSSDSASPHMSLFLDDSTVTALCTSQIIMVPIPSFHHASTLDPRIARTHPGHDYLARHFIKAQLWEMQASLKRNPTPAAGFPFSASQHLALDSSRADTRPGLLIRNATVLPVNRTPSLYPQCSVLDVVKYPDPYASLSALPTEHPAG